MRPLLSYAIVSVFALAAVPAQAETIFTGTFSGDQEFPPVESPGTGSGVVTLSDDQNLLSVSLDFSGLIAPSVDSHIHCCAPLGATAPVAVGFTDPTLGFPFGETEGSFEGDFDLTLLSTYGGGFLDLGDGTVEDARSRLLDGLFDGLAYLNIHTDPELGGVRSGEIRAQLTVVDGGGGGEVPEPAMIGLLGLGLGVLALRTRRRA